MMLALITSTRLTLEPKPAGVSGIRAKLSLPFGHARDLAEIQLCPGGLFCPRLSQPARSRNGSGRRQQEHARWQQSWRHRPTAVVENGLLTSTAQWKVIFHIGHNQPEHETERCVGSLSHGVERVKGFHQHQQYPRRRVHFRRPSSWRN